MQSNIDCVTEQQLGEMSGEMDLFNHHIINYLPLYSVPQQSPWVEDKKNQLPHNAMA